jgi:hypothetical protein
LDSLPAAHSGTWLAVVREPDVISSELEALHFVIFSENTVLERVNRYLTVSSPPTFMRRFRWVSLPFARHLTKFT